MMRFIDADILCRPRPTAASSARPSLRYFSGGLFFVARPPLGYFVVLGGDACARSVCG
jgi:hypothetical protein